MKEDPISGKDHRYLAENDPSCIIDIKIGHSGQERHYYRSRCRRCGWVAKGYRVTRERAREDYRNHECP